MRYFLAIALLALLLPTSAWAYPPHIEGYNLAPTVAPEMVGRPFCADEWHGVADGTDNGTGYTTTECFVVEATDWIHVAKYPVDQDVQQVTGEYVANRMEECATSRDGMGRPYPPGKPECVRESVNTTWYSLRRYHAYNRKDPWMSAGLATVYHTRAGDVWMPPARNGGIFRFHDRPDCPEPAGDSATLTYAKPYTGFPDFWKDPALMKTHCNILPRAEAAIEQHEQWLAAHPKAAAPGRSVVEQCSTKGFRGKLPKALRVKAKGLLCRGALGFIVMSAVGSERSPGVKCTRKMNVKTRMVSARCTGPQGAVMTATWKRLRADRLYWN